MLKQHKHQAKQTVVFMSNLNDNITCYIKVTHHILSAFILKDKNWRKGKIFTSLLRILDWSFLFTAYSCFEVKKVLSHVDQTRIINLSSWTTVKPAKFLSYASIQELRVQAITVIIKCLLVIFVRILERVPSKNTIE